MARRRSWNRHRRRVITCPDGHGRVVWGGDVLCAACLMLFRSKDRDHWPEVCPCGARLAPGAGDFSARAVCGPCVVTWGRVFEPPSAEGNG